MSAPRIAAAMLFAFMLCGSVPALLIAADAPRELEEVPISDSERSHWSYRPMARPTPPVVADVTWNSNPIDAFVKSALDRKSIAPLLLAGKATLLRRVCFDLTGLPPSAAEVSEFLADDAPDAYERLVDRLLASPAYGERYAQHWLDLARFAETDGFEHDLVRPQAWRYRDWVVDALNRDLPYDEFVRLQLAGDELRPDDPHAAIATGFLLCGPDMPDINLQEERRHVVLNEMTATVGSSLLAMQFGCAQCHDHKYDPIRIQDFYRLRAFFEPAEIFRDHPIPTPNELAARQAFEAARDPKFKVAADRRAELEALGRERFRQINPDEPPSLKLALDQLSTEERDEHKRAVELVKSAPPLPGLPHGRVMRPGSTREAHVYLRGDFRQPGPVVECAFPAVLDSDSAIEERRFVRPRTELADWLTQPEHPLVARVIVNRLWQWHFGRPLVATPSDFGTMGAEPTHPELLDWLARQFIADGWSWKSMHRRIVTSRTYRLASAPYDAAWSATDRQAAETGWTRAFSIDSENTLLWHRPAARLDGEAIRDAMLAAGDQLSSRSGGPGIRPPLAPEVTETLLKNQWQVSGDEEDHRRRSIYLFVRRNLRYPMFDVFDRPDTNASCAMRHESTTATQSLTQFNSAFSLQAARWLAGAVLESHQDLAAAERERHAIESAYLRVFNRPAAADEVAAAQTFLEAQAGRLRSQGREEHTLALPIAGEPLEDPLAAAALVDFCLALFSANEFLYLE
jgi:hypothetical protein